MQAKKNALSEMKFEWLVRASHDHSTNNVPLFAHFVKYKGKAQSVSIHAPGVWCGVFSVLGATLLDMCVVRAPPMVMKNIRPGGLKLKKRRHRRRVIYSVHWSNRKSLGDDAEEDARLVFTK
jgi:hypothetical protein